MLEIKGKLEPSIDIALKYYENYIKKISNMIVGDHPDKEDCRQLLRLKVWSLHKNEDRVFNASYVKRRLKWDTLNFINRDAGYNWGKVFRPFSILEGIEEEGTSDVITVDSFIEEETEFEDLILKSKHLMSPKQYEALVIFLSGAPARIVQKFVGTRNKNLTRYYLLLGEAISILRKKSNGEESGREGESSISCDAS